MEGPGASLRQCIPKGTALSSYNQANLDEVAMRLSTRLHKTQGYDTPAARRAANRLRG